MLAAACTPTVQQYSATGGCLPNTGVGLGPIVLIACAFIALGFVVLFIDWRKGGYSGDEREA